jgi:hypothetical protein
MGAIGQLFEDYASYEEIIKHSGCRHQRVHPTVDQREYETPIALSIAIAGCTVAGPVCCLDFNW